MNLELDINNINSWDYFLPEDRIAQSPAEPRDSSRLLVWDVAAGIDSIEHRHFRDITEYFREGDLLILNDTRVLPARLYGKRCSEHSNGGAAEVLLLRPVKPDFTEWHALVRPGRKLHIGAKIVVADNSGENQRELAVIGEEPDGVRVIRISNNNISVEKNRQDILAFLDQCGQVPLPPYIHDSASDHANRWRDAYQTVFARNDGSVAAPTASLHFTPELLAKIDAMGVQRAWVTLHVGLGTFRPVKTEDIREHVIHHEPCEVPEATAHAIDDCRKRGGRVIAAGTTVVRTLESMALKSNSTGNSNNSDNNICGRVRAGFLDTGLFIKPGSRLQVVDALITNFHLPKSSLLMLVEAFVAKLGRQANWAESAEITTEIALENRAQLELENYACDIRALKQLKAVYARAIEMDYRFFSFGDAMFIH